MNKIAVAKELMAIARSLCGKNEDIGKKVTFSADSFMMPFDVPDEREHRYAGKVVSVRGNMLTVKLSAPGFASGQTMRIPYDEPTLEIK